MIVIETKDKSCKIRCKGEKFDVAAEMTLTFITLAETTAELLGFSKEVAAKMIYQTAMSTIEKNEVEDSNESKNN